jgi:hypothetical protein
MKQIREKTVVKEDKTNKEESKFGEEEGKKMKEAYEDANASYAAYAENNKNDDQKLYLMPQDPEGESPESQNQLMTCKSQLPSFYALDVFFKYQMFDQACLYLYYRREFKELFTLIRFEYNENKKQSEALKQKIAKMREGLTNKEDFEQVRQLKKMEDQREQIRILRDEWFNKHIFYMQKINDISMFDQPSLVEKAEDYCTTKSDWVLKESETKWVDCFKKASNLETKANPMGKSYECKKPPFISEKLLRLMQTKGGTRSSLKYMEYLTIKCNVPDRMLHLKYGVQQI